MPEPFQQLWSAYSIRLCFLPHLYSCTAILYMVNLPYTIYHPKVFHFSHVCPHIFTTHFFTTARATIPSNMPIFVLKYNELSFHMLLNASWTLTSSFNLWLNSVPMLQRPLLLCFLLIQICKWTMLSHPLETLHYFTFVSIYSNVSPFPHFQTLSPASGVSL